MIFDCCGCSIVIYGRLHLSQATSAGTKCIFKSTDLWLFDGRIKWSAHPPHCCCRCSEKTNEKKFLLLFQCQLLNECCCCCCYYLVLRTLLILNVGTTTTSNEHHTHTYIEHPQLLSTCMDFILFFLFSISLSLSRSLSVFWPHLLLVFVVSCGCAAINSCNLHTSTHAAVGVAVGANV